nr:MAG TPA: hypothetical protein [Bacteriophage sp.]
MGARGRACGRVRGLIIVRVLLGVAGARNDA